MDWRLSWLRDEVQSPIISRPVDPRFHQILVTNPSSALHHCCTTKGLLVPNHHRLTISELLRYCGKDSRSRRTTRAPPMPSSSWGRGGCRRTLVSSDRRHLGAILGKSPSCVACIGALPVEIWTPGAHFPVLRWAVAKAPPRPTLHRCPQRGDALSRSFWDLRMRLEG
jgi:hypothetical protein